MKKLCKDSLMLLILALIVSMCAGCVQKLNYNNEDKLYISGKPKASVIVACELKNEYSINDDIVLRIYYGTAVRKEVIDHSANNLEEQAEGYKAELSIINEKYILSSEEESQFLWNPFDFEERISIKSFDDFYSENYPITNDETCNSYIDYVLQKTLLIGDKGLLLISIKMFGNSNGLRLEYIIEDGKIVFNKCDHFYKS